MKTNLRSMAGPGELRIDAEAGIVRSVAIASIGEVRTHGFNFDSTSLEQMADLLRTRGSLPVRISHPEAAGDDGIFKIVGTIANPQIILGVLRGDLELGTYAQNVPGLGDVRTYLLELAQTNPKLLGMSVVMDYQLETVGDVLIARVFDLYSIDIVADPAANKNGLLSTKANMKLTPQIKEKLVADYGLNPSASDEQAQAFLDALSTEEQGEITSAMSDAADESDDPPASLSVRPMQGRALLAAERHRVGLIRGFQSTFGRNIVPDEIVRHHISKNSTPEESRTAMLKHISDTCKPLSAINVGDDRNRASLSTACADALTLNAGYKLKQPNERSREFVGMTVLEMGRRFLEQNGIDTGGMSRATLARCLLNPKAAPQHLRRAMLAESTSDFPSVLTTHFGAVLRNSYQEQQRTWPSFARRGILADFTSTPRPNLSAISTPVLTDEGGELKYDTLTDKNETIKLAKYTRGVKLTMEAIINDRLNGFARIFEKFAQGAARLEDDVAYTPITGNQVMTEDTVALFDSTHSNDITSGADPSVTSMATMRTKLALQTGLKGETLNLQPAACLVPVELATITEQLVASTVDPSKNNAADNPAFIRSLVVISNARLSANSSLKWYVAASPTAIDGIEVAFLQDEPEPVIRTETDFDTEDQKYALRHCVASRALDFRFIVRNAGT